MLLEGVTVLQKVVDRLDQLQAQQKADEASKTQA